MLASNATTPTSASPVSNELSGLGQYHHLKRLVETQGACELPGVSIKYHTFMPVMWRAVQRGFVKQEHATFVAQGLRYGFMAGVDVSRLTGHRWHRNYASSYDFRDWVTTAVMKRVEKAKTIDLGAWGDGLARTIRATFRNSYIFPMGAVKKALEDAARPTDDHTKTGLNAATDLSFLRHSLTAYEDIAAWLHNDYFMRVSDVSDAFPMLPLHPALWPFFMFRFFADAGATVERLFMHVCGDFGAAGMPGTFHIFFSEVVVGMARSELILTLPMAIHVDDCGLIGPRKKQVDEQMTNFHEWALQVCGVIFKWLKDRLAAQNQLMLGFWWDSTSLTRTLDEKKLLQYTDQLFEFAGRRVLSLHDMQVLAGRMHRAILTLPPGAACLLQGLFVLMAGLTLPWMKRRISKKNRADFRTLYTLLKLNLGRGYYSYANFEKAPGVRSDACKSKSYVGGGYVSQCGRYNFWQYGSSASRKCIDFLEGDTVITCVEEMARLGVWFKRVIPFGVDNMSFEKSAEKGRSVAQRLNELLRELFALQVQYTCILSFYWLSSADNLLADLLSRDDELEFLRQVYSTGFWTEETVPLPHPSVLQSSGQSRAGLRRLPEQRGDISGFQRIDQMPVPPRANQKCACKKCANVAAPGWLTCWACVAACTGNCQGADASPVGPSAGTHGMASWDDVPLSMPTASRSQLRLRGGAPQSHNSTVPYSRSSIFSGLPDELHDRVEDLLDNRYKASSWRTISAGLDKWRETAAIYNWTAVIPTDDPARGGKLAAHVMRLVDDTSLAYKSIEGYMWGMRTWQTLQAQADPIYGVMGWDTFMDAVKVLTWVPSEPRRATDMTVMGNILGAALTMYDEYQQGVGEHTLQDVFVSTQHANVSLALLYTFSRSESPLPKNFTGPESFNASQHWQCKDVSHRVLSARQAIGYRMKIIKQDQRMERPTAAGNEDWSWVGSVDEEKWDPVRWCLKLASLHGRQRDPDEPYFLSRDMTRPYTYSAALADHYKFQRAVGVEEADLTGLHGCRVAGWNATKATLGEELAQAHGLWAQTRSARRYDRFALARVERIPSAIAGLDSGDRVLPPDPGEFNERPAGPPAERLTRGVMEPGAAGSSSSALVVRAPPEEDAVPPGWTSELRSGEHLSRSYRVFHGPNGEFAPSRAAAWRVHLTNEEDVPHQASVVPEGAVLASPTQSVHSVPSASGRLSPNRTRGRRSSPSPVAESPPRDLLQMARQQVQADEAASSISEAPVAYATVDEYVGARGGPVWDRPSSRRPPVSRNVQ